MRAGEGLELVGRDFGLDGVHFPEELPFAIGAFAGDEDVTAGDGVRRGIILDSIRTKAPFAAGMLLFVEDRSDR